MLYNATKFILFFIKKAFETTSSCVTNSIFKLQNYFYETGVGNNIGNHQMAYSGENEGYGKAF